MNTWKIITISVLAITAAALLFATVSAQMMGGWGGYNGYGGMMGGYGGGGMMGGNGYGYGYPAQTNPQTTNQYYQPVYPFQFGGAGCHGGYGTAPYGASAPYTYTGTQLNITTAKTIAQNYIASTGNPDLAVNEIEEYQANYYVQVKEVSTGNGAFELLINKYTGSIYPEMGPNMMWNTKYGMMRSGILGGIYGAPTADMPVSADQAKVNAQQFLDANYPATTVGEVFAFYGYYHVMVEQNGKGYGMLSVNGYSGQAWYHTWHGAFIQELEIS